MDVINFSKNNQELINGDEMAGFFSGLKRKNYNGYGFNGSSTEKQVQVTLDFKKKIY